MPRCPGRILAGIEGVAATATKESANCARVAHGQRRARRATETRHYGLWQFFEFGAFADDHHDRNELGAFARHRAREKHGLEFESAAIDVIGDTPHDIACGKAIGARTIAVATGSFSREQLAAHEPDFIFPDFSKVDAVLDLLGWSSFEGGMH